MIAGITKRWSGLANKPVDFGKPFPRAADRDRYGLVPGSGFEATSVVVHRAGDHRLVTSAAIVAQLVCVRDAGMHRPMAR